MDWLCSLLQNFETGDWIALIAGVSALFAAWQAYRSNQASRATHLLAVKAHQRQEPSLEVNLANASWVRVSNPAQRVYVFELLVSNLSIVANSIKRIALSIEHGMRGQPLSHVAIPHSHEVPIETGASDSKTTRLPVSIGAGESLSIVTQFLVAEELLQGGAVESCSVVVIDSHDRKVEQKAILLWESEK